MKQKRLPYPSLVSMGMHDPKRVPKIWCQMQEVYNIYN